jgi:hypothetical protein
MKRTEKKALKGNEMNRRGMVIYQQFGTYFTMSGHQNRGFTSKWHKMAFGSIIDKLRFN